MEDNDNEYYNSLIYNGTFEDLISLYIKKYGMADFLEYLVDILRYRI